MKNDFHCVSGKKFTVLDRTDVNITQRVAALVHQLLARRSVDRPLNQDDNLTESGLSSLDAVNLMLAVEAEFDVKIPEPAMIPSNFRTIARIDALVRKLLSSG